MRAGRPADQDPSARVLVLEASRDDRDDDLREAVRVPFVAVLPRVSSCRKGLDDAAVDQALRVRR